MPLLNSRGQVLAGIAGQQSSVDGVLLPVQGYAAWLDDDHVLGQSLDATQLLTVPIANPSAASLMAGHAASRVVAGAGRWASVLYTSPTQVDGALGQLLGPDLYAAGPDGTIAWKRDRQASSGVVLTGPTGSSIELPSANPTDLQVLSSTEAIWCEGPGQYRALGRAVLRPAALTQRIRIVTVDGEDWLIVAGQDGGLVAHLDGETDGYILVPASGEADNHDARLVNGQIVVTWSVTMGERPLDVRTITIDRTQARVALVPSIEPVTFTFTHPVLVAPFKDPQGQTPAPAEIVVNQAGQTKDRPYIAAVDSLAGPFVGPRLGLYVEGDPTSAIAQAESLSTRVFVCHDGPDTFPASVLAQLRPFDVPMLELYLVVGETPATRQSRWQRNLASLLQAWSGDIGLVAQCYCAGGAPPNETFAVADVVDALRDLSALVNASARVKVIAPFSYLRANGIVAHSELSAAFNALLGAAAQVGVAQLAPIAAGSIVARPGIQVINYGAALTHGQPWELDFVLAPDSPAKTQVRVRLDADGNLWITTTNAGGSDATGALRHVEVG